MRLVTCEAGALELPALVLNDRLDGGHLVVQPPRPVWDRTALTPAELTAYACLVAAAASAMMEALPQLEGGCINYWDAGNWALNENAAPIGAKRGQDSRQLHLHLFGRSRHSRNPDWLWGEAPRFPSFADRLQWAAAFEPLTSDECRQVASKCVDALSTRYSMSGESVLD